METLDLISGRDAAKLLKVAPATIGNRIGRGELKPYARLDNGTYLFERGYIQQIARAQQQTHISEPAAAVAS